MAFRFDYDDYDDMMDMAHIDAVWREWQALEDDLALEEVQQRQIPDLRTIEKERNMQWGTHGKTWVRKCGAQPKTGTSSCHHRNATSRRRYYQAPKRKTRAARRSDMNIKNLQVNSVAELADKNERTKSKWWY